MRGRIGDAFDTLLDVAFILLLVTFIGLLVSSVLNAIHLGPDLHSTWPESAEFSQLMTGQDRFSEHETNVSRWVVVVDHATGNQYIASVDGDAICPILDVDGTPLRVMEAADDGEEK